jgi:hypothetical protein
MMGGHPYAQRQTHAFHRGRAMTDDRELLNDDDVARLLRDLMRHCDAETTRRLGRPLYIALICFPSRAHELVSWIANAEPAERDNLAQAMIELLTRWGYIVP